MIFLQFLKSNMTRGQMGQNTSQDSSTLHKLMWLLWDQTEQRNCIRPPRDDKTRAGYCKQIQISVGGYEGRRLVERTRHCEWGVGNVREYQGAPE